MSKIVTVDFRSDTLFAVERDDGVYVAIKPICDTLGIDWKGQRDRIARSPVLSEGRCVMPLPSVGGTQETVCLRLDLINGWLFGIDAERVRPECRDRVLEYQRECYRVLFEHFYGKAADRHPAGNPIGADPLKEKDRAASKAIKEEIALIKARAAERNAARGLIHEIRMSMGRQEAARAVPGIVAPLGVYLDSRNAECFRQGDLLDSDKKADDEPKAA